MPEIFDNRYEIIRRLGSGGMADVYLARDTHLGRDVAIKILYKRYASDSDFVTRFKREAQAAAGLNHPHIVSIYDRGETEGSYYIAMEYLEGKSLKEVISDEGRLQPARAIGIAEQILQALSFAHENHVIHRDIKPHNIIINSRDGVKVTDFGIARAGASAKMTETGSILGTAQYLSPEQAQGKVVEQGSDLYSLGVVLFEMLTGRVPFEGENPVAIALKHLSDAPVPPQELVPEIPDNLNAVVMKALAKDPQRRYRHADEFLADLRRCQQDLPVAAPPADDTAPTSIISPAAVAAAGEQTAVRSRRSQPQPPKKRRRLLYLALLAAALALAAIGIYLLAFAQKGTIDVPDVVGVERQQAERIIRDRGLVPEVEAEEFSDQVPAGSVIRQNPEGGSKLKEGGTVRLVISRGGDRVTVPSVVGQTASYAESKLREAGLSPERQPDAFSDTVAEGSVISQDPAGGSQAAKGSTVRYVVSKGEQPPNQVAVPDLSGLSQSAAESRLASVRLELGTVSEAYSDTVPAGQVIIQNPAAGREVDEGSSVNITVSLGPEPDTDVTVPSVVTLTEADAVAQISGAGLVPSVNPVFTPDPAKYGRVISQSPSGGSTVPAGSTVTINVGQP